MILVKYIWEKDLDINFLKTLCAMYLLKCLSEPVVVFLLLLLFFSNLKILFVEKRFLEKSKLDSNSTFFIFKKVLFFSSYVL